MRHHPNLVFSFEEYERRLTAVRQAMSQKNIDVAIVCDPANLAYLTGYQTTGYGIFQALIIPMDKEPCMVTRLLEESNAITRTWVEHTHPFVDTEDPIKVLKNALHQHGLENRVIAYEKECRFLSREQSDLLDAMGAKDCSHLVESIRLIKSDEEVALMRRVAEITMTGMKKGIEVAEEGSSENLVAAAIHEAMYRHGGEYPAVAPYVTSGPRTIIGHATWEGRPIGNGDCVFLELAGCLKRYHVAMMRTLFIGGPPREMIKAAELVRHTIETAMAMMKPGTPAEDVDATCREIIAENNFGAIQMSRSGYSIGIAFAPSWDEGHILSFKEGAKTLLQENMTFHLIPWIQLPKLQMVMGLSETVLITASGAKSFCSLPREFVVKERSLATAL